MDNRIKEILVIPEGSSYGVNFTYHYGDDSCSSPEDSCPSPQGLRSVFSKRQLMGLEIEFQMTKYINNERRKELATILGMQEKQVKQWFQNRRSKAKRNVEKIDKLKRAREPENNEGIYNIDADFKDQGPGTMDTETYYNSVCDLEDLLEVLKKPAKSPPLKRRCVEILEHLVYDPINRTWTKAI